MTALNRVGTPSARNVAKVLAGLTIAVVLSGCAGYVPGAKSYWDARVKELCAKDGGVKIYEKLHVTKTDIENLGRVGGGIAIPIKRLADPNAPVYAINQITHIRDKDPEVWRSEWRIIRRKDQAVIAIEVSYHRAGGDAVVVDQPSGYTCPAPDRLNADLQSLFVLEGGAQ